jgi:hypothetical protein
LLRFHAIKSFVSSAAETVSLNTQIIKFTHWN